MTSEVQPRPTATRNDYHFGRRLFHFTNGTLIATAYHYFFTHQKFVSLIGVLACLAYLFEQLRMSYPDTFRKLTWISHIFLRAEEELKESAMIPYAIAILLTIITFPKPFALIAIYTLAIADPLSALVGIKFGKHKIYGNKSIEGSSAFFLTTFIVGFVVLHNTLGASGSFLAIFACATLTALFSAFCEVLPIKLDDNFVIPLTVGILSWSLALLLGLPYT